MPPVDRSPRRPTSPWIVPFLLVVAAVPGVAAEKSKPPAAPVEDVSDTYWGVRVPDPYRWMEKLADPRTKAWIKGQADFTNATMASVPRRDELKARIAEYDSGRPFRRSSLEPQADGTLFHLEQAASENLPKLVVRRAGAAEGRVLLDPSKLRAADGGHVSISWFQASPDGKKVVVGLAPSGSEEDVLHVFDVATGAALGDTISRMEAGYVEPMWLPDGSGFFYSRRRALPPDAPETEGYRLTKSYLHRLGTSPDTDVLVFAHGANTGVTMSEEDFPAVVLPGGSPFAIGQIKHGDSNELTLYAARLDDVLAKGAAATWRLVCDVPDSVVGWAVHGSTIDLVTALRAPRYRIVRSDLGAPDFARATEIVPAGSLVIDGVATAKDALYVQFQRGGAGSIGRVPWDGAPAVSMLPLPDGFPAAVIVASDPALDGVWLEGKAWTRAGRTFRYDAVAGKSVDSRLNPEGRYDAVAGYASLEVEIPSHDGVMVPLSILYKEGTKKDGSNPTLLTGYGSYGINRNVAFDARQLAWLERGGVIAVAHVRGGGELGQEWHEAGRMTTKPNTWKDFIACGEWLVKEGWTSPAKLAGQGGSAGGITIGRAITERPDLFAAALVDVGSLDAVRMETTMNGIPNIMEFGTVKKEDQFHALLEMSAYHHVTDGVKYPAVMLSHGIHDPRVEPWTSAKMCARLQAATASGKPVLFRVDYGAGHGIGSTRAQQQATLADKWAFLLWQMDTPKPLP